MKNILIINTHQYYKGISAGGLNKMLVNVIREEMEAAGCTVQQTNIEQGYDINEEIQKHLWADVIILQSPVYWFGTPWIYKRYVDEIFTSAMMAGQFITGDGRTRQEPSKQYGTGGTLQGKKYMLSLTWNAPKEAFGNDDQMLFSGKTVDEVFIHNTTNYKFCGVEILPSFSCYDVVKNPQIDADILRLRKQLSAVF